MSLPSCIVTLFIVYPLLLVAGCTVFRHFQKTRPQPLPIGDPRTALVKPFRFIIFVLVMPLGLTLAFAIMGWLDPLFHAVQMLRIQ